MCSFALSRSMASKSRLLLCCLFLGLASLAGRAALAQTSEGVPTPSRRVKVSDVVASSLIAEKTALQYPDSARNAGIQGTVVLNVVTSKTGDVKEVTVISGDPSLAQAAADAVKQWKYKPYVVDGSPVEMETQVSINFHLKSVEHAAPPLGAFKDDLYSNEFFDVAYPLSRDWVRETEVMRKRVSADGQSPGIYVLLAAVHIPQQTAPLEADSSFVLSALESANRSCEQYLQSLGNALHSRKEAQQKGTATPLTIAGRDFYRIDFEFRESPSRRTFLCTQSKNYLLQWNIVGLSKGTVESSVSTLNAIHAGQSQTPPAERSGMDAPSNSAGDMQSKPQVVRVRVAAGVTQGLILKKVPPVYPQQAKYAHIQGSVRMSAIISKNGDVVDLEILDGPIELAVSAVNAVRQWKYRPYVLNGEPVEVGTEITVNYVLSG
jgi:TonB family protein